MAVTVYKKKFSKEIIEQVLNNNDCSESKLSKKLMLGKSDIKLIRQHIATGSVSSLIEEEKPKETKQKQKTRGGKLSNAEKILIIDHRNKGESYRKIAADFGISDFTVRKICIDNSNDFINLIDDPDTLCREFIFRGITDKKELSRLSRTTDDVINNLLHRFENAAFTFNDVQDSDTGDENIEKELLDEPLEYDPVSEIIDIKDACITNHDNILIDTTEEVSSYPNITTYNINGVNIPNITIDYYISGNTLDISHDFVVNIINLYISDTSLSIKDHIVHVQDVLYIDSYMIMWLNSKLNVFNFEPAFSLINEMYAVSETDKNSYYENRNAILENDMKEVRKAYKILHKILINEKEENEEEYVDYCEEVIDSSHYIDNSRSLPALSDDEYYWRKSAEKKVNEIASRKGGTFGSINSIIFNKMNRIYGIVWDQCRKDFKRDYNIDDHVTVSKWRLVCHNKSLQDLYDTVLRSISE